MILGMSMMRLIRSAKLAKLQTNRPIITQLVEIARLRLGPGKINAREYFDYRLFDPKFTNRQRSEFVGGWAKGQVYQMQDPQWAGIGNDKLMGYLVMAAIGMPIPRVKAVSDERRYYPGVDLLSSANELMAWLRKDENYPFFSKPSAGAFGHSTCFATHYDSNRDSLVTVNGDFFDVSDFATKNCSRHVGGYIFQDLIELHPDLVDVIGRRIATARIVTMTAPDEPRIHRAIFKIPTGPNFTDNFDMGSKGNGFALIDLASGKLKKAYSGVGLSLAPMPLHADTGRALEGLQLPDWNIALNMVKKGQKALSGLRIIGWDVAFTPEGPIIVELNTKSGYTLLQAAGQGYIDAGFRELFPSDYAETRRRYPNIIIGSGGRMKP